MRQAAFIKHFAIILLFFISENAKPEKVVEEYTKILSYLDRSYIKKLCGEIALKVVKYGCYYGYLIDSSKSIQV